MNSPLEQRPCRNRSMEWTGHGPEPSRPEATSGRRWAGSPSPRDAAGEAELEEAHEDVALG